MKCYRVVLWLSLAISVSSFQMVCHIFCGVKYVRKCRNQFFYNAISEVYILFVENNIVFVTNIHVKIENLARVLILGLISSIR